MPRKLVSFLFMGLFLTAPALVYAQVDAEPEPPEEAKPDSPWPYQEPLYALYADPTSHVRLRGGYAQNPQTDSLAFVLEGAWSFGAVGLHLRLPLGLAMDEGADSAFTWGDVELGVRWRVSHEPSNQRHLTAGLDLIGPTSRIGEESDVAAVQEGERNDDSNFGKRYLLAQKPLLDMGLIPRTNFGLVPWVAFGQNLGRVSLQADFGCILLVMDNMDETVYGTDERLGVLLFFDLAAPVAISEEFSLVAEFNGLVAVNGLSGTGFAITLGPRYTVSGFTAALGVQLPLGVDNKAPDDDKILGRYDAATIARHHFAAVLDLAYRF